MGGGAAVTVQCLLARLRQRGDYCWLKLWSQPSNREDGLHCSWARLRGQGEGIEAPVPRKALKERGGKPTLVRLQHSTQLQAPKGNWRAKEGKLAFFKGMPCCPSVEPKLKLFFFGNEPSCCSTPFKGTAYLGAALAIAFTARGRQRSSAASCGK